MDNDRLYRLISRGIEGVVKLLHTGVIVVAAIWLGSYARDVLIAFAGKETVASIAFTLIGNLQIDRWAAYLFGLLGVGYGAQQRRLRQRNIRRLTEHTAEVETRLHRGPDPGRKDQARGPIMSDAQFTAAISVILSFRLVLLVLCLIRGYRADNFRDQLFTLRDEMFLYAVDQGIVGRPAYENLRLLMNGLIRYAHRVSFTRLLLLDLCRRVFRIELIIPPLYANWIEALRALPADQAARLEGFHETAMLLMLKHMISGSPLLWFASAIVAAHDLTSFTRIVIDRIAAAVSRRVPPLNLLEADALRTL